MNRRRASLKKTVRWVLLGLTALSTVFVAFNAVDSQLSPEAETALECAPESAAPGDNFLHVLYGFDIVGDVRSTADMEKLAEPVLARIRTKDSTGFFLSSDDVYAGIERIHYGHLNFCNAGNDAAAQSCVDYARTHRQAIKSPSAVDDELVRRYRLLRQASQYVFDLPRDPTVLNGNWSPMLTAQQILLSRISIDALDHDSTAIEELIADINFWRHLLSGCPSLIGKMVASSGLRRTLGLVGDLLRAEVVDSQDMPQLQKALWPLTASERTLGPIFDEEFRFHIDFLRRSWSRPISDVHSLGNEAWNRLQRLFFLENSTANRDLKVLREEAILDALPCNRQMEENPIVGAAKWSFFDYIRNPVGNSLVLTGSQYHVYTQRMCNLDGLVRIAGLHVAIKLNAVSVDEVGQFVQHDAPEFNDPYTDRPMRWERGRGLSFEPHGPDNRVINLLPWPIEARH